MPTIHGRLAQRAAERPDDVAIELVNRERLTFRAWHERSNAAARGLRERGLRAGERVVVYGGREDWIELAVAYLAVLKAGGVALPVATSAGHDHLAWAWERAGAAGLVGASAPADAEARGWQASAAALAANHPGDALDDAPAVAPEDPAEILYTSGTTGRPKGVVASHANMLAAHDRPPRADAAQRRVLHCLPPASMVGQGLLLLPLHPEPHVVLTLPTPDARELLAAVRAQRPTDLVLVPAIAAALTRLDPAERHGLDAVGLVRTTSAPIAPATLAQLDALFPQAHTINLYATTESWPARTQLHYDAARAGSVGRPGAGAAVRVIGADGTPCAAGEHGDVQLQVRGAAPRRYFEDDDATREVFLAEGWVRTGDTGYVDVDGYLYLVDRNADLVNVGGLNVSTIEIEGVLEEHPGVRGAAVVGLPHPALGESLVAAVEASVQLDPEQLRALVERRLGAVKVPRAIVVVDALPRNVLGKLLKRELRERLAGELGAARAGVAPQGATEERIATIWQRALGLERVAREDNFFDLGGTSLTLVEVTAAVGEAFGVDARARDLLTAETLADYAGAIDAAPPATAANVPALTRVPRSGE